MIEQLDPALWPLMLGLFGAGGISGLFKTLGGARGVMGGLSLLGSALLEHQAGKAQQREAEDAERAAKAERQRLQREATASQIQQQAETRARREEAEREAGALRANLASRGLSLSGGVPRDLVNLLARKRTQEEDEQQQLDALERAGLTSAIGQAGRSAKSARKAAGTAGFLSMFSPGISLLGGLARI